VLGEARKTQESPSLLALLFTDGDGRIVFVDSNFLKMMDYSEAGLAVGEPLYKILGIERQICSKMMQTVAQNGFVHNWPLELQSSTGKPTAVTCTGIATYDERHTFIGMDMTIRVQTSTEPPNALPPHHRAVLNTRIRQIQTEVRSHEDRALKTYTVAQIGAVEILLARMAGPRINQTLEQSLNKLAAQRASGFHIQNGHVVFDEAVLDPNIYLTLLKEVHRYAVGIVGRRMVISEMQAVDEQVDEHSREIADQAGLREFISQRG